jgi:hypothetical protein
MIAITAPRLRTKNQVTKSSGKAAGERTGCKAALKINRTTNPTIQNDVLRRSSSKREPSGHSAAQIITTLDCLNPPRLSVTSHGRRRMRSSWVNR